MKTILLLILSAFTASAATTYPVMTDNANRTFSGGATNLALLNGTNTFTGTNRFANGTTFTTTSSDSSTTDFQIKNSSAANLFSIRSDQYFTLGSGTANTILELAGTGSSSGIYSKGYSSGSDSILKMKDYNGNVRVTLDMSSGTNILMGVGTLTPSQRLTVNGATALLATSAPTPAAGEAYIYSKTSGTTEIWVMDSAGNETQISPHARSTSPAPASVDAGDKTPIVIHHRNLFTGEQEWLHLSAMARKLEQLTGEKFVFRAAMDPADVKDWASAQEAARAKLEAEHAAALSVWLADTNSAKGPRPTKRTLRTEAKPAFLQ